jgi:hypothetical protein
MTDMTLPLWIYKHVSNVILSQQSRYTTKHRTSNHVAILFLGRKMIAIGQNRLGNRRTIHAEMDVIREVGDTAKIRGATLLVIRIGTQGNLMNSAPCPACKCLLEKCKKTYGLKSFLHS